MPSTPHSTHSTTLPTKRSAARSKSRTLARLRKETAEREQKEREEARLVREATEKAKFRIAVEAESKRRKLPKRWPNTACRKPQRKPSVTPTRHLRPSAKRMADALKQKADDEAREADRSYRKLINTEIMGAFLEIGIPHQLAINAVAAIVAGKIPHVKVVY